MTTVALEKDKLTLQELAALAQDGPVLITERGQPKLAVLALDEAEAEAWVMGQSEELMALVERSRQQLHVEGGLSLKEMREKFGTQSD